MQTSSSSNTTLQRGEIVLARFPFTDLSATKLRPAVIVWADPAQIDFTLAFVSSQNLASNSNDVVILPLHPEFALTGLSVASRIRAEKLVTLSRPLITRRLGKIGALLTIELDKALISALGIDITPFS